MITKPIINEKNIFVNSVVPRELDDRARLRVTRSKLIAKALEEFVTKMEQGAKTEVKRERQAA